MRPHAAWSTVLICCIGSMFWPGLVSGETPPQAPGRQPPLAPCFTAGPQQEARQEVILRAESLEYFQPDDRVVASGEVSLTSGDMRLLADRIELDTVTGTGVALGNVRLLTSTDDIRASRLDFNINTQQGLLYEATGLVGKSYRVAGERIERIDPRTFSVQRGRFTTCPGARPDWEIRAPETRLTLQESISLQQPSFWIKGVPVFYLPYAYLPIRDQRTTGFLPPRLGVSNTDGFVFGEDFFWAMTDWADSTFGLEYLSKKGWKPNAEFRYVIDPLSDGLLQGSFIHENDTGEDLWRVLLQQRQEFGWGLRALTQLDLRSERDIVRRFSRALEEESAVRTASFGTLTKLLPDGALTLAAESFEGIPDSGGNARFRRLPTLSFEQFPTPLFGRAFFALETSYSRLSDTAVFNNMPVQRVDLFPRLMLPVTLSPWMRLTATGGFRETWYDRQATRKGWTSRDLFDLQANLEGPAWRRRYTGVVAGQTVVHLIETRLAYRYVPSVRQAALPRFEALDEAQQFLDPLETFTLVDDIQAANYAKVSLVHSLFAQPLASAQGLGIREVARLVLSQGWDVRRATTGGSVLGPLDVDLEVRLWPSWTLETTLRLDPASGRLQESRWRIGLNVVSGWALQLANYRRQEPDINYFTGGVQVTPLAGLLVGYNVRYDAGRGDFREHLMTVNYQTPCWRVQALFRVRPTGDTEFFMQANLLNL